MIIIGTIFILCGGCAGFWAYSIQNPFGHNCNEYWVSPDYSYANVVCYIGILTLIIGIILLIIGCTKKIAQSNNSKINNNIQPIRSLTTCINCREEFEQGSVFCPFCGTNQNAQHENKCRLCKSCGAKINNNVNFCSECGSNIGG